MNRYLINDDCQIEIYHDELLPHNVRTFLQKTGWQFDDNRNCWVHAPSYKALIIAIGISGDTFEKERKHLKAKVEAQTNTISLDYDADIFVVDSMQGHIFHNYSERNARIKICDKRGILTTQIQPVFYCENCQRYYISSENYKKLCVYGAPLANFYSRNKGIDSLREESPLKLLGYTVSQKDALNPREGQRVLKYIYEEKIMPKQRIIAYWEWYIRSHPNEAYEISRKKWADDIEFVHGL